jgi:hypothetical protein
MVEYSELWRNFQEHDNFPKWKSFSDEQLTRVGLRQQTTIDEDGKLIVDLYKTGDANYLLRATYEKPTGKMKMAMNPNSPDEEPSALQPITILAFTLCHNRAISGRPGYDPIKDFISIRAEYLNNQSKQN